MRNLNQNKTRLEFWTTHHGLLEIELSWSQDFDASKRPTDVHFDHMSIWARILNLPFELMNDKWGWKIAEMVGTVEKVEVDAQHRAWGPYLRVKVKIDITKPLRRGIALFSSKRKTTEWYEVRYEKVPNYCYSCGIVDHSSIECPTPAERDANGLLPYGKDLRASDDRKKRVSGEQGHSPTPTSTGQGSNGTGRRDPMSGSAGMTVSENRDEGIGFSEQQNVNSNVNIWNEELPLCKMFNTSRSQTTKIRNQLQKSLEIDLPQNQKAFSSNQGKKRKMVKSSKQQSAKKFKTAVSKDCLRSIKKE